MGRIQLGIIMGAFLAFVVGGSAFFSKYRVSDTMIIPVEEVRATEYLEDPADRSIHYDRYSSRYLRLVKKDPFHFDFIFESMDPNVATVSFKNVDLRLFLPIEPKWVKDDPELRKITYIERQWNRQQIAFRRDSPFIEVSGGDGFEKQALNSPELVKNELNAGLWEVQLFTNERGKKALYYHGWFRLPLGHYKRIFEEYNRTSYWKHWLRLEYWLDPTGTPVNLSKLRKVLGQRELYASYNAQEKVIARGEQVKKARMLNAKGVRCWGDFCGEKKKVEFATFEAPGRYNALNPRSSDLERFARLEKVTLRKIKSPGSSHLLDEIELIFMGKDGKEVRFIVGGVSLQMLPALSMDHYPKGFYMPMGISVPPYYQMYEQLQLNQPQDSPYYCLLLDSKGRFINHHAIGIEGPVMHLDVEDPNYLHLYFLSYERHSLVRHFVISLSDIERKLAFRDTLR